MYSWAKEKAKPQSSAYSSDEDENGKTEQDVIAMQAQRVRLPKSTQTYQQAFQGVYTIYGPVVYTELWNAFYGEIPLDSTDPITAEHMKVIADFIVARELIAKNIYTSTAPENMEMDVTEIKNYLQKIPFNVLKKAISLGQFLTATNDNITNHARMKVLKGLQPRGWQEGQTWESVKGIGAAGKIATQGIHPDETIIALSKNSAGGWSLAGGHSSTNLVLHEYAHAIDRSFGEKGLMGPMGTGEKGDYLSRRNSFVSAWKMDLGNTTPESYDNYYWQGGTGGGAEEAFAEGFSDLYLGSNARNWPNIKAYIEEKMKSIK